MRLIDLQSSYITQISTDGKKGSWKVYNADKEEIYTLPKDWNEKQVMVAIHLGRKFELIAFNKGVNFYKSKVPKEMKILQQLVLKLKAHNEIIKNRNIMLSNELEKLNRQLDKITFKND